MSSIELPCQIEPDDLVIVSTDPTGDETIWLRIISDTGEHELSSLSINLSLADAHHLRDWLNRNLKDLEA